MGDLSAEVSKQHIIRHCARARERERERERSLRERERERERERDWELSHGAHCSVSVTFLIQCGFVSKCVCLCLDCQ
jgi:hypothetical protein